MTHTKLDVIGGYCHTFAAANMQLFANVNVHFAARTLLLQLKPKKKKNGKGVCSDKIVKKGVCSDNIVRTGVYSHNIVRTGVCIDNIVRTGVYSNNIFRIVRTGVCSNNIQDGGLQP